MLIVFGILGYGLRKLAIDASPLIIALVLGPLMEKALVQTLFMERGRLLGILSRPLALSLLLLGVLALLVPPVMRLLRRPRIVPELSGASR